MSERVDRKLKEVAIAHYAWRHEAEFAAGFLEDAGIPYRLQVDEPLLGAAIPSAATLWVLGAHERQARDVIGLDTRLADRDRSGDERGPAPTPRGPRAADAVRRQPATPRRDDDRRLRTTLSGRERGLSLLGAGGLLATLRLFRWEAIHPILPGVIVLATVLLTLAGVAGWAPGPLRRLLGALAGSAP